MQWWSGHLTHAGHTLRWVGKQAGHTLRWVGTQCGQAGRHACFMWEAAAASGQRSGMLCHAACRKQPPPGPALATMYGLNRRSLMRYAESAHAALRAFVYDAASGAPLAANVSVLAPNTTELAVPAGRDGVPRADASLPADDAAGSMQADAADAGLDRAAAADRFGVNATLGPGSAAGRQAFMRTLTYPGATRLPLGYVHRLLVPGVRWGEPSSWQRSQSRASHTGCALDLTCCLLLQARLWSAPGAACCRQALWGSCGEGGDDRMHACGAAVHCMQVPPAAAGVRPGRPARAVRAHHARCGAAHWVDWRDRGQRRAGPFVLC